MSHFIAREFSEINKILIHLHLLIASAKFENIKPDIMKNYNKLTELISLTEEDAKKFFQNGNSAAGTRIRKAMQEIKVLAQEIRNEVSEIKKKEAKG
jgi:hypothetical protein